MFTLEASDRGRAPAPASRRADTAPSLTPKHRTSREWYAVPRSIQAPSHAGNGKTSKDAVADDDHNFSRF